MVELSRASPRGDLSAVCRARSVFALRRRLDGGDPGERRPRPAPDPGRLPDASHRAGPADPAPGPGRADDRQELRAVAGRSRHPGQLQPASNRRRQPLLGEPLQKR